MVTLKETTLISTPKSSHQCLKYGWSFTVSHSSDRWRWLPRHAARSVTSGVVNNRNHLRTRKFFSCVLLKCCLSDVSYSSSKRSHIGHSLAKLCTAHSSFSSAYHDSQTRLLVIFAGTSSLAHNVIQFEQFLLYCRGKSTSLHFCWFPAEVGHSLL